MPLPESSDEIQLLHNPKCSKCRATVELLEERGIAFTTRLYLEDPLDRSELEDLAARLGRSALEFTRTGQAEFEQAGLSPSSSDEAVFEAMAAAPVLMERPVLIRGQRAVIGRPPESVLPLATE